MRKRVVGNAAFGLFGLYICHIVFCTIVGVGWIVGSGSDATLTPGVKLANKVWSFSWGGEIIRLNAGQAVEVNYTATIERGHLIAVLKPNVWLMGLGAERGEGSPITSSGKGTIVVQAPTDGWYKVQMMTRSDLSSEQLKARSLVGPRVNATLAYRARWRIIG